MNVKVYQEIYGGCPRKGAGRPDAEGKAMVSSVGMKSPMEGWRPLVCWQFNEGVCSYDLKCKFHTFAKPAGSSTPRCNALQWEDKGRDKDSHKLELEGVNLQGPHYTEDIIVGLFLSADVPAISRYKQSLFSIWVICQPLLIHITWFTLQIIHV